MCVCLPRVCRCSVCVLCVSCWFQCCRMVFKTLTSTLSFRLQSPSSSQKQTHADVTDAVLKQCRANLYTCCQACCNLTHTHTHTLLLCMCVCVGPCFLLSSCTSALYSQRLDIIAAIQLLDEESGIGKRGSTITEVIQEVQVLHQSIPVHQVRAGEVRKFGSFC